MRVSMPVFLLVLVLMSGGIQPAFADSGAVGDSVRFFPLTGARNYTGWSATATPKIRKQQSAESILPPRPKSAQNNATKSLPESDARHILDMFAPEERH